MNKTDELQLTMPDSTFFRTARKVHRCHGGFIGGVGKTKCDALINRGDRYVEYLGETPLWQSGQRYHMECARQNGLLE